MLTQSEILEEAYLEHGILKKADELEIAVTGFTPETHFDNSGFIIYTTVAANAKHSVVTDRGSGICITGI